MTAKQIVMRDWVDDNSDIVGNSINDYYTTIRKIALECSSTRGDRNGHNDKSFVGPERISHLWNNRNDVVKIVTDYINCRFPNDKNKIDHWMSKFDKDIVYTIYRFFHSNRSYNMIKRYHNKIKRSPGNNGRQRAGQMIAILVFMKNWVNNSAYLIDSGFISYKVDTHIKGGSKLLGTDNKVFCKTAKSHRETNLNKQHTVKKITIDSKIIHEID